MDVSLIAIILSTFCICTCTLLASAGLGYYLFSCCRRLGSVLKLIDSRTTEIRNTAENSHVKLDRDSSAYARLTIIFDTLTAFATSVEAAHAAELAVIAELKTALTETIAASLVVLGDLVRESNAKLQNTDAILLSTVRAYGDGIKESLTASVPVELEQKLDMLASSSSIIQMLVNGQQEYLGSINTSVTELGSKLAVLEDEACRSRRALESISAPVPDAEAPSSSTPTEHSSMPYWQANALGADDGPGAAPDTTEPAPPLSPEEMLKRMVDPT
jgi:hypothetical protein